MNVWIFNHYAEPPNRQATRSYDLGRELVRRGHRVCIFASSFSHYEFRELRLAPKERWATEMYDGVRFVWLRTPPYRANDWRRIANVVVYAIRAWYVGARLPERPDVIIGVSVHPLAALAAWLLSRTKRTRFAFEVTDLWPETLVEFGALSERHPVTWALRKLERFLYRRAEKIVLLLRDAASYVVANGGRRDAIVWIPNGVDLNRYRPLWPYDGGRPDRLTVMYIGGLVHANAVDVVLEAAAILQQEGVDAVQFILVGGGQERDRLVTRARNLRNVEFRGVVPKADLATVMQEADVFVSTLRRLGLYRYGISLNKVCDYLASGRPILFSGEASYNPVEEAGAGLTVAPEEPNALADAVKRMLLMPPERRAKMGQNGVEFARRHHDIHILAARLEEAIRPMSERCS